MLGGGKGAKSSVEVNVLAAEEIILQRYSANSESHQMSICPPHPPIEVWAEGSIAVYYNA